MFTPEFKKTGGEYYVNFNNKNLAISSEISNQWFEVKTDSLEAGNYSLRTNLPVGEIKTEYLASPFWVMEDKELGNDNLVLSDQQLSFTKINPTKYEVKIVNSKDPYLLVLSEAFNSQWRAYYNRKEVKTDHFLANGYANGWFIKPELLGKETDYTLELVYRPQKFTDIGTVVSIATVFLSLSYLTFDFFKNIQHKKRL